MVNGKTKGGAFENKILKKVREVYPDSYKTLGSGNTEDDKGDIVFKNFLFECKYHKSFTHGQLIKWWDKICDEAGRMNKIPILVFKENRKPVMVMYWNAERSKGLIDLYKQIMFFDDWLETKGSF